QFSRSAPLISSTIGKIIGREQWSRPLTTVHGVNPITGHESTSLLYSKLTASNLEQVFQTPIANGLRGTKAIVYQSYDGDYYPAFLTEIIDTHHRHAAATVAQLIDNAIGGEDFNKKTQALYDGNSDRAGELLTKVAGFELQYDPSSGRIIAIQQDSWLTKEQQRTGRALNPVIEEDMILALFEAIRPSLLSTSLQNLDNVEEMLAAP
ncbi:MAG TPA: hypothetical protein VJK52_02180, partial [Candidatus Nanoarchaeia archaeon]|nr:hypothetical protein [Candidatus Nanoarchaeia archaeon]